MVMVRGRNSSGKTVKQTVKNGRKSRVTTPRGRHESSCQASAVRCCVPILINPEFDAALDRDTCVTHWMSSPGSALWYTDIWQSFFFFFFCCCCRFVSAVWQEQWQSTARSVTQGMLTWQRKKCDVILRFLVDRYRRTKPPKPDASQFVVPARLPKPAIGSGGLSSSRFDDDVPEVNCTWTSSFSWRVKDSLRFGSNRTAPKIWQEGQHDLHSPPQPIDWREHTIGAVHDRNLPTRSLQVPESYENFLWHRVKVRSIVTGLRHDDERDDDRSQIAVIVVSASCHHLTRADSGWSRISWFSRVTLPWLRGGTSVAPWRHKCSHVPVFGRLFDRLPVRISTSDLHHRILRKKLYHIRAYDFGVQFSFKVYFHVTWRVVIVNSPYADTVRSGAEERSFSGARLDVLIFRLRSYHVLNHVHCTR